MRHAMPINVEVLKRTHIDSAMQLVEREGWNQLPSDWERVIDLEPEGCFCAMQDQQLVGTVTTTRYGDRLAWIGMMLVDDRYRRLGIGRRLMQTAIEYLQQKHVRTIKLDATPVGKLLYDQLGFKTDFEFFRWTRPWKSDEVSSVVPSQVSVQEPSDPQQALMQRQYGNHASETVLSPNQLHLDVDAFGANRFEVLMALSRFSTTEHFDQSFGMLRNGRVADYLGPVTSQATDARRLIEALLMTSKRTVLWDILSPNAQAAQLAAELDFTPTRPLIRMTLGEPISPKYEYQFAIADPAVG